MAVELKALPAELPEKPTGWTKHLLMHMNFGEAGGAASYDIKTPKGELTPIGYQYDTRLGGLTGFNLPDRKNVFTWAELRAEWPVWRAEQEAKVSP